MGNHFKSGLFCLIFAFAVITSYAENSEEPDKGNIEFHSPNEEYVEAFPYYDVEFDGSSSRVKRDMSRGWPSRNPPGERGRSPPGGRGRFPPGGRGRAPLPLPMNQRPMAQREIDIQRLNEIRNFLARITRLNINSGIPPQMARVKAMNDNPATMREVRMLERRNPGLEL